VVVKAIGCGKGSRLITPEEILVRAAKLYEPAVSAWIAGDEGFFPCRLRGADLRITKGTTQSDLIGLVERLREGSKASRGFGYRVQYEEVHKRAHGLNNYPTAIEFETLDDLVRLIKRQAELRTIQNCVALLRQRLPRLEGWVRQRWKKLLPVAQSLEDLLAVTEYIMVNPRPGCYLRELPLAISSKLVETHKGFLSEWWDQLLPESAIEFGAVKDFERRYGFSYPRTHLMLRVLDDSLVAQLGLPCCELSMPAEDLAGLPLAACRLIVVENKINLLTLPPLSRTLAFGGMGNNLSEYRRVAWFRTCPLMYWGDLDEAGLLILARARHAFPQLQSFLMDARTLGKYRPLVARDSSTTSVAEPAELLADELQALRECRGERLRLEQERIPQADINELLQGMWGLDDRSLPK
jgi:hypothetical protein